jgi:hypothetical protein
VAAYRLLIKSSAGKELDAAGTKADRLRIIQRIKPLPGIPGLTALKSSPDMPTVPDKTGELPDRLSH